MRMKPRDKLLEFRIAAYMKENFERVKKNFFAEYILFYNKLIVSHKF